MVSQSKPEASYASTRLTTKNYNGPGLLSMVGGRTRKGTTKDYKIDSSEEEEDTRSADEPAPNKTEEVANSGTMDDGPATDDDPLSSSDESDRSAVNAMMGLREQSPGHSKVNTVTETKESQSTNKQGKGKGPSKKPPRQGTRRSSRHDSTQVTSPKRTANEMMAADGGGVDEDDELSFTYFDASQATKKRKRTVYKSSNSLTRNIHTSGGSKVASSPDILSQSSKQEDSSSGWKDHGDLPPRSMPGRRDDTKVDFRAPPTFDILNPKSKIPPPPKLAHGFEGNEQPQYHIPPTLDDSDVPIHSSQATGSELKFKNPATLPTDNFSNSSLTTSSSKNNPFDYSLGDDDNDSPGSPLSSVASRCSHDLSQEQKAFLASDSRKPQQTECPMCGASVDAQFLEEFLKEVTVRERLNVRQQNLFCRRHRKRSAELVWVERGYPEINWESFHKRVQGHFPALEKVIAVDGQSKSFFRNALDSSVKTRGDARLTIEGNGMEMMSSGYYGSKGSRRMLDAIITRYSSKIRRLAHSDSLIKATGVSGFAQAVLVPELSVLLIKEDMGIDDEAARQIIRDSMEIGDWVNSEENDVVKRVERRR